MNILQVNYYDNLGGAARIVWSLHQGFRELGHHSWIASSYVTSHDAYVRQIPPTLPPSTIGKPLYQLAMFADQNKWRIGTKNVGGLIRRIADPARALRRNKGFEDFDFPESRSIISLPDDPPQIIHLHNLHLNYFDLTYLPELSQQLPVIMTLHDMWPLTGHCAHGMKCERWKTGCGDCPQLDVYPAMSHDQTAFNWQRKRDIYAKSKVYLAGPSNWMVETAKQSILAPAIIKSRVIPNGIDLTIFHPSDKLEAREKLGLPKDASILLFVSAGGIQRSSFKDYFTIQKAIELVSSQLNDKKLLFIALGDIDSRQMIGDVEIRYLSHVNSPEIMAQYYQAADIYLHASKAESFGLVLVEAQACGTPVIATSVGGIPDTIKHEITGFLSQPEDPEDMASKIVQLLSNNDLMESMGKNASQFAKANFGVDQMIASYLSFYQEILSEKE